MRGSPFGLDKVMVRGGAKIGDTVTEESLKRLRAAAADLDEHVRVEFVDDGSGNLTVVMISQ